MEGIVQVIAKLGALLVRYIVPTSVIILSLLLNAGEWLATSTFALIAMVTDLEWPDIGAIATSDTGNLWSLANAFFPITEAWEMLVAILNCWAAMLVWKFIRLVVPFV